MALRCSVGLLLAKIDMVWTAGSASLALVTSIVRAHVRAPRCFAPAPFPEV